MSNLMPRSVTSSAILVPIVVSLVVCVTSVEHSYHKLSVESTESVRPLGGSVIMTHGRQLFSPPFWLDAVAFLRPVPVCFPISAWTKVD